MVETFLVEIAPKKAVNLVTTQTLENRSEKTNGIQVNLSENVKGDVELNQNTLCGYGSSEGLNSG